MNISIAIYCFQGGKMFLSKVELSNWRRFSKKSDEEPGLTVEFSKGLNVLVGENDSGKTAIIDAIKVSLWNK